MAESIIAVLINIFGVIIVNFKIFLIEHLIIINNNCLCILIVIAIKIWHYPSNSFIISTLTSIWQIIHILMFFKFLQYVFPNLYFILSIFNFLVSIHLFNSEVPKIIDKDLMLLNFETILLYFYHDFNF